MAISTPNRPTGLGRLASSGESSFRPRRRRQSLGRMTLPPWLLLLLLLLRLDGRVVAAHTPPAAAVSSSSTSSTTGSTSIDLGTTLVAIRYEGGLIVGADSRTSVGGAFVSHKSATKMVRLTSHACLLRSGSAADTQRLASDCRTYCRNREWRYGVAPTVAQIASFLRQAILAQLDGDNDGGNSDFAVSLLVAGYDPVVHGHGDNSNNSSNNNKQQPRIYSVARSGALSEEDRYAAAGSGSAFVLGLLDDEFHPQRQETLPQSQSCIDKDDADNSTNDSTATTVPLTQQEAVQLCRRAVAGAIRRDGSSGGLIRLAVLDADGMRELDPVHPEFLDATTTCDLVGFAPATRGSA